MCEIRKPFIIEAVQKAAQAHGIKAVAAHLDKRPSTLYGELSPWPEPGKAKLGLDDALEIMRLSGDHTALALMAESLGYRLESVRVTPDHDDIRDEMLDDTSRVGLFHTLMREGAAVPVVVQACHDAHRELDETLTTYKANKSWKQG